jgi:hypothetical protein
MTQEQIAQTIQAVEAATAKALRSKKASRQFLVDAGIIPDIVPDFVPDKKKKEKKKR